MALSVKTGVLTSETGTGNKGYTGVGFQPKLVMFFANKTAAEATRADNIDMVGAATSSTARWAGSNQDQDNVAGSSQTVSGQKIDKCISISADNSTTVKIEADFVSMDADGFTLNWTTVDASGWPVFWVAYGGDAITNVLCSTFNTGTATTNLGVTGVGFQPNLVLFHSSRQSTTAGYTTTSNLVNTVGAAVSSTSRWAAGMNSSDAFSGGASGNNIWNTLCYYSRLNSSTIVSGDFETMDADGFTVDRIVSAGNTAMHYIAFNMATAPVVGVETQKASTGTKATTGTGFTPAALLFVGRGATTLDTPTASIRNCYGVAISGEEFAVGNNSEDATGGNTITASSSTALKALRYASGETPTVLAEADLSSLDSDGFTLDWTTADATARLFGWVALGAAVVDDLFAQSVM